MGVDSAVLYTLVGRGWGLVSGVVTLFFVVRYLSADEQGYYYTFASLLAMQVLFELGMSYVVMQFASHEMANLSWSVDGTIEGGRQAKSRLRSLLLLVTKWYGAISAIIVVVIIPIGWWFFTVNYDKATVEWQAAWIWLVLVAAISIFIMPILAFLEGCGRVTEVAQLRMFQNITGSLAAWVLLASGGGLLAMPAMSSGMAVVAIIWLWRSKKSFLMNLLFHEGGAGIKWKTEIWPLQWRIALSWLSGYFIFQLFVPVLFAYRGPVEAGQMGLSFSLASALISVAMAWMGTKAPRFGTLVAMKDYPNLDQLFKLTFTRSLAVMALLGAMLCAANYIVHMKSFGFASRLLDPLPFTLLILATIMNYVTFAQSAYLRAHKQEPFLLISLVSAGLIAVLTFLLGKNHGAMGIMAGYFGVCLTVGLGWGSLIFHSRRKEWQKKYALEMTGKEA